MIEFFKQRKIILIIGVLAIALMVWNIYNSQNDDRAIESAEILISENNITKENKSEDEEEIIVVHITGEVKKPGVVKVKEGSRIENIIEAAGGLTENADITDVNLAYVVEDGVKIRIPSNNDEDASEESYITEDSGKGVMITEEKQSGSSSIVNINTATQTELEELPGIGPSIATRIIEYRDQNGKFKSVDDIKNVTGIGDSKFEKIKDYIKVK